MEKKEIPGFEDTHSRLESLSILDCNTIQDIQEFVDMDLSGWTFIDEDGNETEIDTEPDWIPDC
tara:strand:- start:290 stop:481 length:192 start_codon:yes stop_codon:yes gene_type:complete